MWISASVACPRPVSPSSTVLIFAAAAVASFEPRPLSAQLWDTAEIFNAGIR